MNAAVRLLVLGHTKVGESSIVVHTLSPEYGRRGFITSVPRSSSMALFLPLNILEAEVIPNSKSDLWRVRNLSACYPLDGIRSDIFKNTMTLFMSEVVWKTLGEGALEPGLFEWCERSVLTLDALRSDYSNFHLKWLLDFCDALGFRPSAGDIAPFAGNRLREIRSLMESPLSEALLVPMNGSARSEVAGAVLSYLDFHSGSCINIQSLGILSELFK